MHSRGTGRVLPTPGPAEAQGEFAWAGDMWNLTFHTVRRKINRGCR